MTENKAINQTMLEAPVAGLIELRAVTSTPKISSKTGASSPSIKPETIRG
jgi:hypothetical protein